MEVTIILTVAGDIFLRPPDEESTEHEKYTFESEDFRTMYKVIYY